ncbi:hypothetical protein GWK36_05845 [Caldichromatium japonicum]|uniref:Uncharacterized protein n=2 Tax=Caldichromatium japonicum TaxID=2699430 RepID=A0A6G7VCA8_9GAMM|nr:hypothetical protein GWK36_05845 [Caldichromatium japonicum]
MPGLSRLVLVRPLDDYPDLMLACSADEQAPSRTKGDLKKATVSHLRRLLRLLNSPQRVMRYFQHPKLHDAA